MIKLSYAESLAFKKMGFREKTEGYFVVKVPIDVCCPDNWNNKGEGFVSMPTVYQAVEFLSAKKRIYISISVHTKSRNERAELMATDVYKS